MFFITCKQSIKVERRIDQQKAIHSTWSECLVAHKYVLMYTFLLHTLCLCLTTLCVCVCVCGGMHVFAVISLQRYMCRSVYLVKCYFFRWPS